MAALTACTRGSSTGINFGSTQSGKHKIKACPRCSLIRPVVLAIIILSGGIGAGHSAQIEAFPFQEW
jgi:hypothetical protein